MKLQPDTLLFVCRHHVLEQLASFDAKTTREPLGPKVFILKWFDEKRVFTDQDTTYQPIHSDENVQSTITPAHDKLLEFAGKQLNERHSIDAYCEFLEVSVILLGEVPVRRE